jgi:hypothetical protein
MTARRLLGIIEGHPVTGMVLHVSPVLLIPAMQKMLFKKCFTIVLKGVKRGIKQEAFL